MSNIKSEMDSNERKLSEDIVRQMEYYFGDFNQLNDYFMKDIAHKHDGWVPIDILLKFNRLKSLVKSDTNLLINSVKNSNSALVELSECETKVRRKLDKPLPELSEEYKRNLNLRTVRVKGFPKDITLEEVSQWCGQYGDIESVQMLRYGKTNDFNGCIFCTFTLKSMADQLINEEVLKYKDEILLKENKVRYYERKRESYAEQKRLRREAKALLEQKKIEENGDQDMKDVEKDNPIKVESAVLKLNGLPRKMGYEKVKQYFNDFAKVLFVTKINSLGVCLIRFANRYDAKTVLAVSKVPNDDKTINQIVIEGNKATAEVLTGEEENNYWIETNKSYAKYIKRKQQKKVEKQLQTKTRKRTTSDALKANGTKLLKAQNNH